MKVLILEDEAPASRRIKKLIHSYDPDIQISAILESVADGLTWFKRHPEPDLIFSDIQLADQLSFELFRQIQPSSPIIFTTAYDEYALRAFKHYSLDYLLKPIRQDQLSNSIDKYYHFRKTFHQPNFGELLENIRKKPQKQRFLVQKGDRLQAIPTQDVAYFFAEHATVSLITRANEQYFINYSLDELEHQLDEDRFFRANRQFLIAFDAISQLNQYFNRKLLMQLEPDADKEIIVSKEKASRLKEWLDR